MPEKAQAEIKIRGLVKTFEDRTVLDHINLDIPEGKITCLVGQSGQGKTAIARNIMRMEPYWPPDAGRIIVHGADVTAMTETEFREFLKKGVIGYVYQGNALWSFLSVAENVAMPLRELKHFSKGEIEERVRTAFEEVNLNYKEFGERPVFNLSAGEAKKVAVARLVALNPLIKIFDEPTTGFQLSDLRTISALIKQVHIKRGGTTFVISHDLESVYMIADHVFLLRDGKIYFSGTCEDFKKSDDTYVKLFRNEIEKERYDEVLEEFNLR